MQPTGTTGRNQISRRTSGLSFRVGLTWIPAFACVSALVGVVPVSAQDWLVDPHGLDDAGLGQYWLADVPVPAEDALKEAHLVDDSLYLFTEGGIVFAIQADTGLIRWAEKIGDRDFSILKPAHIAGPGGTELAVFPTSAQTYLLDRYTGRTAKTFTTHFPLGGSPVGKGDALFFGSADGKLYAILWNRCGSAKSITWWEVWAGGPITTQPILFNEDRLIAASQGGWVFSCFASDKALVWSRRVGGAVQGQPFLAGESVYIASADRSLYKFNAETGRLAWRYQTESPLATGPVVFDGTVYQYSQRQGLLAINAESGAELWRAGDGMSVVCRIGTQVVVRGEGQQISLYQADSGMRSSTIALGEGTATVRNLQNDALYVVGTGGRTLCVMPQNVPYIHPSRIAAARAQLNRKPQTGPDNGEDVLVKDEQERTFDPLRSRRDRGRSTAGR